MQIPHPGVQNSPCYPPLYQHFRSNKTDYSLKISCDFNSSAFASCYSFCLKCPPPPISCSFFKSIFQIPISLFFFFKLFYVFIYLGLCWISVAQHGFSLVAASRGSSLAVARGFLPAGLPFLQSVGSKTAGLQ